jgi:hypothetical protein
VLFVVLSLGFQATQLTVMVVCTDYGSLMPVTIEVSVMKLVAGLPRPMELISFLLGLPTVLTMVLNRLVELCFSPRDALGALAVSIPCSERRHASNKK